MMTEVSNPPLSEQTVERATQLINETPTFQLWRGTKDVRDQVKQLLETKNDPERLRLMSTPREFRFQDGNSEEYSVLIPYKEILSVVRGRVEVKESKMSLRLEEVDLEFDRIDNSGDPYTSETSKEMDSLRTGIENCKKQLKDLEKGIFPMMHE